MIIVFGRKEVILTPAHLTVVRGELEKVHCPEDTGVQCVVGRRVKSDEKKEVRI